MRDDAGTGTGNSRKTCLHLSVNSSWIDNNGMYASGKYGISASILRAFRRLIGNVGLSTLANADNAEDTFNTSLHRNTMSNFLQFI